MRSSLLVCAAVAACGGDDPVGITLQIAPMAGVDTVELFVAVPASQGLSGPPGVMPMAARYYEVPNDRSGPSLVDADEAILLVNDTGESQAIEMLVVLGYDKDGNAIAAYKHPETILVVPGKTELWTLELAPAEDIVPGAMPQNPEVFRARRWKRSDDSMPSCAIVEHDRERYALGPIGDRDCDEHTPDTLDTDEDECAPWVHLSDATAPQGFVNARCGTRATLLSGYPQACLASGDSCSEVGSTNTTCARLTQDYCVPPSLCECPTWDTTCVTGKLDLLSYPGSFIKCHVCQTHTEYLDVRLAPLLGPSPSTCTDVRLRGTGLGFGLGDRVMFSTGELKRTDANGCSVDFEWNGTPINGAAREVALVSLDLDNAKHIVVPLFVEYGCDGGGPSCEAYPREPETVRLCAEPPAITTCGADVICAFGQSCGSVCCAPGESCSGGQCVCGMTVCGADETCNVLQAGACGSECCPTATGCP